ncbi:MAG: GNAT family protein [Rhodospirillaceae bacterium]
MKTSDQAIIQIPGYTLRSLRLSDAKTLSEFSEDERYWQFLADGALGPAQAHVFVSDAVSASMRKDSGDMWWAIEEQSTQKFVGMASLKRNGKVEHRNYSVGCAFAPHAQGQGLGTSLGWALISYAFESVNAHRVECSCSIDNDSSVHIMKNIFGMTYEGVRREHRLTSRGWWSSHVFSILEDEFAAKSQSKNA